MRHVVLTTLLSACLDFDDAYQQCHLPGGRCAAEVSMAGGTTAGGMTAGGMTAGGMTAGGMTAGGSTAGGMTAGGMTAGGLAAGGLTAGGLTAGGMTAGGSTAGGMTAGGLAAGGLAAGGLTAGGLAAGGLTAGGLAAGGLAAGGLTAGGMAVGGGMSCGTCTDRTFGLCVTAVGANTRPDSCGIGGVQCADCGTNGVCDPRGTICKAWQAVPTNGLERPFPAVRSVGPGSAFFGSELGRLLRTSAGSVSFSTYLASGTGDIRALASTETTLLVASFWNSGIARLRSYDFSDGGVSVTTSADVYGFDPVSASWSGVHQVVGGRSFPSPRQPRIFARDAGGWEDITPAAFASIDGGGAVYEVVADVNGDLRVLLSDGRLAQVRQRTTSFTPLGARAGWMSVSPRGITWVVGDGLFARVEDDGGVSRFDGGSGARYSSVWAAADDLVFAVGRNALGRGVVFRVDGQALSARDVSPSPLIGVHGVLDPLEVWATDADGGIWRYASP